MGGEVGADDIIRQYQETTMRQQSFICEGTCFLDKNTPKNGNSLERIDFKFGTDGDRVSITTFKYKELDSFNDTINIDEYNLKNNYVWDGDRRYDYKRTPDIVGRAVIRETDMDKKRHLSLAYPGAPLMGIMFGDYDQIGDIIQKADNKSVREGQEKIGDSWCYVIDASTKYGEYSLWIDPGRGHNIVKAKIIKEGTAIVLGNKLSNQKFIRRISVTLDNVKLQEKNGIWVPMSSNYEHAIEYFSGDKEVSKQSVELSKYEDDPDFDELNTFKPEIDNGAAVYIENISFTYEWIDGKLVPNIDRAVMGALEDEVKNLKSEVETTVPEKPQKIVEPPIAHEAQDMDITEEQQKRDVAGPSEEVLEEFSDKNNSFPPRIVFFSVGALLVLGIVVTVYLAKKRKVN